MVELERKIEDMQDEEEEAQAQQTPQSPATDEPSSEHTAPDESFMSESIYKKLPSPRGKKQRTLRKFLAPCLTACAHGYRTFFTDSA